MQINPESYPEKKAHRTGKRSGRQSEKSQEAGHAGRFAGLTRSEWSGWLKGYANEERYLALMVRCPGLARDLLHINHSLGNCWKVGIEGPRPPTKATKSLMVALQSFIDGLILISDQDYLDSVGFDFSFVCCPQKLFDTLSSLSSSWLRVRNNNKINLSSTCLNSPDSSVGEESGRFLAREKEEWIYEVLKLIENDYASRTKQTWDPQALEKQKNEKKEFGNFWKSISKATKMGFLLFDHETTESLALDIQAETGTDTQIDPQLIEDEIKQLMNLDKKEICNKIFKCKIRKCEMSLCIYYQMIYRNWRSFANKKKSDGKVNRKKGAIQSGRNSNINGTQTPNQNSENIQRQKVKEEKEWQEKDEKKSEEHKSDIEKYKRQTSPDQSSNETNQSQLKKSRSQPSQYQINKSLEEDILEYTDYISQASNKFHERRVLAFERISAIFRLYNVQCRLFGSCASGITIQESDIDIAINEEILAMFGHEADKKTQMNNAFQFMGSIFESLPWVSSVKVIKTAAIPIIKLAINTKVEVEEEFFNEEYREWLNREIENSGQVHADLTIEIIEEEKEGWPSSTHLGIVSTQQINQWMEQIGTLRTIIIMLKYQIAMKSLNETYLGGLNTYCLVVMVVSYIFEAKLQQETNVAVVLMRLLNFYGWQFDQLTYGVDLRGKPSVYYYKSRDQPTKYAELQVRDPLNNGKVMTRNCYQFPKIRQLFQQLYTNCLMEKQQLIKDQWARISKRLSKRKNKEESETESGEEKESNAIRNLLLERLVL